MKKLFTLVAAMATAMTINAQSITFGDAAIAAADLPATFTNGEITLAVTNDGKIAVDLNNANFGTADEAVKYSSRLKTGGKSSAGRFLTLSVPSDGTVKIAARTGKNSDTNRNIVLTQGGTELANKVLLETEAIEVGEGDDARKVYPYVTASVKKGDIDITFPTNSINIYAIEFVAATSGIKTAIAKVSDDATYNLAGQRVDRNYKGVVIKNGKKTLQNK